MRRSGSFLFPDITGVSLEGTWAVSLSSGYKAKVKDQIICAFHIHNSYEYIHRPMYYIYCMIYKDD